MPRAKILFEKEGFEVISYRVDFKSPNTDSITIIDYLPNGQSLGKTEIGVREMYTVRIEGEIQSPGSYPYVKNMRVEDLIFMANGFKESAARTQVEIARRGDLNSPEAFSEIITFPINADLTLNGSASNTTLLPFDLLTIRRATGYGEQLLVEIEGEVLYPGKYGMKSKKETISDLIQRAGGLKPSAYAGGTMLIRRSEYLKEEGNMTNYRGAIKRVKVLTILEKDTATYAAAEAKFNLSESIGVDLTAIMTNPKSEANMTLMDGDILSIPRKLSTVRVRGEVLNPGKVKHLDKLRFGQYISRSGGFSSLAKKSKSYIIYANGSSKQTGSFLGIHFYPKVLPGAEIVVPQKPISTKTSVAEIVGLASALASLTLIINSLIP